MSWGSAEAQRVYNQNHPEKIAGYRARHKEAHAKLDHAYQKIRCVVEPQFRRWKLILYRFGLTKEQWENLFKDQGNCCAICGSTTPKTARGWSTDHDPNKCKGEHGFVRGILCHPCNLTVSKHATPDILRRAAAYMEKNND